MNEALRSSRTGAFTSGANHTASSRVVRVRQNCSSSSCRMRKTNVVLNAPAGTVHHGLPLDVAEHENLRIELRVVG